MVERPESSLEGKSGLSKLDVKNLSISTDAPRVLTKIYKIGDETNHIPRLGETPDNGDMAKTLGELPLDLHRAGITSNEYIELGHKLKNTYGGRNYEFRVVGIYGPSAQ